MHKYMIRTDAVTMDLTAPDLDDAARQFAAIDGIGKLDTMDELVEHIEAIAGAWIRAWCDGVTVLARGDL